MIKRRLIPKLQIRTLNVSGNLRPVLVTTNQFGKHIEIGDPVSQARIYEAQAADELIILDLDATENNRGTLVSVIRKAAEVIFMPFTVGGGISDVASAEAVLSAGADKISTSSAAFRKPEIIQQMVKKFGPDKVTVAVDINFIPAGQGGPPPDSMRWNGPKKWMVTESG